MANPKLNVAEFVALFPDHIVTDRGHSVLIGDMGRIHIFKEANGQFRVTDVSY